ncbi:PWWP domain-containing protein 2A [Genypterus blacodes]|uniref:PWWP domain-containing protein 2A n=1 Tax=Genypterus blacodes TaxID=154954 RepID=UPI003F75976D
MAAVAAEPGAAVIQDEGPVEPEPAAGPGGPQHPPAGEQVADGTREYAPGVDVVVASVEDDGEEHRHVRPELQPAAGKALIDNDEVLNKTPLDRNSIDRFSPGPAGEPEVGGTVYRSMLADPQPSAVFLHSFPDPSPVTEAGLSLAEPAEPTTNVTTDRDRGYAAVVKPEPRPDAAEAGSIDGEDADPVSGVSSEELPVRDLLGSSPARDLLGSSPARDLLGSSPARDLLGSSPARRSPKQKLVKEEKAAGCEPEQNAAEFGLCTPPLGSVEQLRPGSEVRVSLDHVIDDALVVSFRLGEKVFSGVLMDVSKRFGPYGIPITVFPRRDDRDRPQPPTQSQQEAVKQEEVSIDPSSPPSPPPPPPHPWTSKPPPLFHEGAPYPPPLFIRDTYNQPLPQPPPRKIKRPKRRYRCEEPTSIMNAIKLRPRQVLCDKCKGVVTTAGPREVRRAPVVSVDLRGEETSRRRRPTDGPVSTEVKRLRSDRDEKGGRSASDRRSSSGIQMSSSSSSSSQRVLRTASSSTSSTSNRVRLKLNSKKVLAKGSTVDRSKARQVLKKLARNSQPAHQRPKDQDQDRPKAVTRATALQSHNQKVHFTRRLQHLNPTAAGSGPHAALPPRMRLKPQRYRTDEGQASCSSSSSSSSVSKQCARSSPPKSASGMASNPAPIPSSAPSAPCSPIPSSSFSSSSLCVPSIAVETQDNDGREEEGVEQQGQEGGEGEGEGRLADPPSSSSSSSSLDSSHSECSSTETFELPPPADLLPPSSSCHSPLPAPPSCSPSSLAPRCTSSPCHAPPPPLAEGRDTQAIEEEEEGGEHKRRRKSSTSSCSSSSSSSSSVFSKSVSKCSTPDGRMVCVGDIVWAKIYGFPWWPARVLGITVSRRGDTGLAVRQEARVSWFGSPTTSFLPLPQLSPFLETFQSRFDRKRKGPYRRAIAEAASAAKQLTPEVRALLTQFET